VGAGVTGGVEGELGWATAVEKVDEGVVGGATTVDVAVDDGTTGDGGSVAVETTAGGVETTGGTAAVEEAGGEAEAEAAALDWIPHFPKPAWQLVPQWSGVLPQ